MTEKRILIVEDEKKIADLLSDYFTSAGFKVDVLNRGDLVLNAIKINPPDLMILDIMLPGKDGITICQEIRTVSRMPIVMLTAKVDEIDRILGLELGADDYICKPFSPREAVSRVKAILRRTAYHEKAEEELVAGPITILPERHRATIGGKPLHLTYNEFEFLKTMVSQPEKAFTRKDFVAGLERRDFEGSGRLVDTHIKNLRKKMEDACPGSNLIKTIYRWGYSLSIS
jgi:two-component system, OmpR family, response regulator BaeR